MTWHQFKPIGLKLVIKEDIQQTVTTGGIILTEKLPTAAEVGFYTGTVLKEGSYVQEYLSQSESLVGKRICHRQYLADVVKFNEKEDGHTVFILDARDVEAIVGSKVQIDAI